MTTIIRPKSRVEAVVYTHAAGAIVLTPYITGFSTSKHIEQAEGQVTISVKWPEKERGDLRWLVQDGDWLRFGAHGPKGWRRRTGFLLSRGRKLTVGSRGERIAVYQLTFGDEGHPFARHEFRANPLLPLGHPGFVPPDASLLGMVLAASSYEPRDVLRRSIVAMMRPGRIRQKKAAKATAPPAAAASPVSQPAAPPPAPAPLVEGQLTANFHIKEFLSPKDKGRPNEAQQANLRGLAERLQTLRDGYFGGAAVKVLSGFRSPGYNAAVGGAAGSQHLHGLAADIRVTGLSPVQVAEAIARAINEGALPATFGVFLYRTFVHLDVRTSASHWKLGKPTKNPNEVPTDEQASAFLALKPSPGSVTVETAEAPGDDSAETNIEPPELEPETEIVPGESGSGAYTVPPSLVNEAVGTTRPVRTAGGAPTAATTWDWLDVVDLYGGNDPKAGIRGRWWQLNGLYSLSKAQVDGFLRSQADPVFCELFYDSRRAGTGAPSKLARLQDGWVPTVIFRRRPFDRADWEQLPTCTVEWAHVKDEDLALGGAERFNYFYARPVLAGEITGPVFDEAVGGGQGVIPAIALDDFRRWGQRSMEVEARFAFPQEAKGDAEAIPLPDQVRDFTLTLYRWFKPLPELYGGTIEIPWLDAECMVGVRLIATGKGGPFKRDAHAYIEGVNESFVVDPQTGALQGRTVAQVTRMQPLDQYAEPTPRSWKDVQGVAQNFFTAGGSQLA